MPDIQITASDGGSFSAYLAMPATTPAAGLVLIQEIFGVNQVMRDLADGYAKQGYMVACPDLFWRIEPGVQITDQSQAEWTRHLT
jgi:carboxymethylenebutenolidase